MPHSSEAELVTSLLQATTKRTEFLHARIKMSTLLLDNLNALAARLRNETGLRPKDSVIVASRLLTGEDDLFDHVEFEDDFVPPSRPGVSEPRRMKKVSRKAAAPKQTKKTASKRKQAVVHKRPSVVAGTAA